MKKTVITQLTLTALMLPVLAGTMTGLAAETKTSEAPPTIEKTTRKTSETMTQKKSEPSKTVESSETSATSEKKKDADKALPSLSVPTLRTITKGSAFDPMDGVKATDQKEGDLTAKVSWTGKVDTDTVGSYRLSYSVENAKGMEATKEATVTVAAAPAEAYQIELADFSLPKGADYVQAIRERIVIKDASGNILPTETVSLQIDDQQSTDRAGVIVVAISVRSKDGTVTKKDVSLTITDKSSLRIEAKDVILKEGEAFDPYDHVKGIETDASGVEKTLGKAADANAPGIFVVKNMVDTSKAGKYTVIYQARSTEGRVTLKSIIVTVLEKPARTPIILVEDKVMYVGEKLTNEIILSWAKTENPEDRITGFHVQDGKIKVKLLSSTLVEAKVHKLTFYATSSEGGKAEKTIELKILEKAPPAVDPKPAAPAETKGNTPANTGQPAKKPENPATPANQKVLPKTGEHKSSSILSLLGVLLSLGAGINLYQKKRTHS